MSYKKTAIIQTVFLVAFSIPLIYMVCDIVKDAEQSARTEILEQCQNGKSVTIDGVEIHCGVISSDVNLEAARYNAVKQCVKLIGAWNDG
jgi:hypothetical protein